MLVFVSILTMLKSSKFYYHALQAWSMKQTGESLGLQERGISVRDSKPENKSSPANEPFATDETDP